MRSITIAALVAASGGALAGNTYAWDWNGTGANHRGGTLASLSTTYNETNNVFRWEATYSNQITEGFTLAINDGPNPKGIRGELSLLYFDASGSDVNVSAYEYSGNNDSRSWQSPGVLLNKSGDANFIRTATSTDNANGTRTFVLEMDATAINAYYTTADWEGVAFGEKIGLWFHSFKNLSTSYNSDGTLASWSGTDGWLDLSNHNTTTIPMPAAGAMGLAGLGIVAGRRRR